MSSTYLLSRMGQQLTLYTSAYQERTCFIVSKDVHTLARMVVCSCVQQHVLVFHSSAPHQAITSFPSQHQSCPGDACVRVRDAEICD